MATTITKTRRRTHQATTTGYTPLVSKDGGKDWPEIKHAGVPDPDVQLDAAYYLARAAGEQRLSVSGATEILEALDLDRDTIRTERTARAERIQ